MIFINRIYFFLFSKEDRKLLFVCPICLYDFLLFEKKNGGSGEKPKLSSAIVTEVEEKNPNPQVQDESTKNRNKRFFNVFRLESIL